MRVKCIYLFHIFCSYHLGNEHNVFLTSLNDNQNQPIFVHSAVALCHLVQHTVPSQYLYSLADSHYGKTRSLLPTFLHCLSPYLCFYYWFVSLREPLETPAWHHLPVRHLMACVQALWGQ